MGEVTLVLTLTPKTMEKVGFQDLAAAAKMLQLIFQTIQCLRVQVSGSALVDVWVSLKLNPI